MFLGKLGKVCIVLMVVVGAALLGGWLLSASGPEALGTSPASLTFISPIGNPQFGLRKVVDNGNPAPGNQINYTLFYRNTNPGSQAFNVRLYDILPPGAQLVSSTPPATVQDGVLLFTAPSVGPTTNEMSVTLQVLVPDGYPQMINNALVMADGVDPAFASLLIPVALQPSSDLRLAKLGYAVALSNTPLVYTLRCTNVGDSPISNVTVVDVMPTGLPLVGASPAPDLTMLPLLRWSLGTLAAGEVRTLVITTTSPATTGVITNSAVMAAFQNVMTQTVFATQIVSSGPILQLAKDASASTADAGRTLVYTLRYQNIGNMVATNVMLTDTLPADVTVVATNPQPTRQVGQQLEWDITGPLYSGNQGQVVITATVGQARGKVLHNVADITGQPGAYPGHAELDTPVRLALTYLPIVMKH